MNVLFIMSDEHGREIAGCYGNRTVLTPNLDALAARGIVFENAYCNSRICVPSRASLATGDHVHRIVDTDEANRRASPTTRPALSASAVPGPSSTGRTSPSPRRLPDRQ